MRVRPLLLSALVLSLIALPACGDDDDDGVDTSDAGDGDGDGDGDLSYAADVEPVFTSLCTCHLEGPSGNMQAPYLKLNPGAGYEELVGVASEQSPLDRVTAGDPAASYLWRKLEGTHAEAGGSGNSMPPSPITVEPADLAAIEAWIIGGALP